MDWFCIAVACVGIAQALLDCWTYVLTLKVLGVLAFIRFVLLPADCDLTLFLFKRFGAPVESLEGRVVWITGASSGIGKALAIRLARARVRVAISARSVEKLNEVKQKCIEAGGLEDKDVLILPFDMVQYDQHQSAFDKVIEHFGELDILVCNAGRSQRGRWEMIDLGVDRDLFELNVFSLIALSRRVVKYFLEKGKGHLAVTSSTAGKLGAPMSASYTASKHALQGYFDCLRVEKAGCGLDITMFCPGPVDSNLLNVCFTEERGKELGQERKGRRMSAERCADLFAVSIANKLSEVWVADQPVLTMYYLNQFVPSLMKCALQVLPLKAIMKLRDGRDDATRLTGAEGKKES
ncbi:dehydrogenase/reductase SDR family member 7-like [Penaeus japonicus]|uniref:dehydrogenase/reductase SDR family member 7-like n=1 Tax=Penaeus japonicus TaxID=27405 RepID=UPI001C716521|nr:dehydrogenase/reductase SDR family member 7-like [Penaeus japonicus]